MTRRRRHPAPEPLPDGMMLYYGQLQSIASVERTARSAMKDFDTLPQRLRMACNAFGYEALACKKMATAQKISLFELAGVLVKKHARLIVKARSGART